MSESYPYVLNNGKIGSLFEAIENASKPGKFTHEFLKRIGFPSSNDRGFISLFRHLGLVSDDNIPTDRFDEVRDARGRAHALGEAIKEAYADLFSINTNIHKASDADIRSAISRVTGKDAAYVNRAYSTFKSLLNLATFDERPLARPIDTAKQGEADGITRKDSATVIAEHSGQSGANSVETIQRRLGDVSLSYNIEIHLPATTDISVYNAIFRSLRDTLGVA